MPQSVRSVNYERYEGVICELLKENCYECAREKCSKRKCKSKFG